MNLTGKQRRRLRALGHHLTAVLQVGHQGVTAGLVAATEQALYDHELIKIKVSEHSPEDREEAAEHLARETGSVLAQVLGRTALLFKPRPEDPIINLDAKGPAVLQDRPAAATKKAAAAKKAAATKKAAAVKHPARGTRREPRKRARPGARD